jgi:hypothetical protein
LCSEETDIGPFLLAEEHMLNNSASQVTEEDELES